jgi:translation initiation factor IF-1
MWPVSRVSGKCCRPGPERAGGTVIGAPRQLEGRVTAQLPSGLYQVDVEGARITAHIGGGNDRNFVRVIVGDRVVVELTPRDLTRGRIVKKAP